MKTNEFIKIVEANGFYAENMDELITVFKDGMECVELEEKGLFKVDSLYGGFNKLDENEKSELFKTIYEYISTPIEEREEKKRYKYKLKDLGRALKNENECSWLIYNNQCHKLVLGYVNNSQPQFQMIFEEDDPLLESVNLDMFDKIEVDEDENAV